MRLRGHAIEARINAEDPAREFLPSAGRVLAYQRAGGDGVRVDDAIETGTVVDTRYDSLLAKVIAHGDDRTQALARLERALADQTILGVTTTTGFLRGLLADDAVRAGALDTGLVSRRGVPAPPMSDAGVALAAAMLTLADRRGHGSDEPFARIDGWRLGGERAGSHWRLAVGAGEPVDVEASAAQVATVRRIGEGRFTIGERGEWLIARDRDVTWIGHGGWAWPVRAVSAADDRVGAADGDLRAPMPGQVLVVPVAVGDPVSAGDPVVVLESMKMELVLAAPMDGSVTELTVSVGDRVSVDQPLARVEATST
ncbi:MAG: biotin/lipoyl-containing protein [Solirubrobacteraceae bacterium]